MGDTIAQINLGRFFLGLMGDVSASFILYRERDRERERRLLFDRERFRSLASDLLDFDRRPLETDRRREPDRDRLGGGERLRLRDGERRPRERLRDLSRPESHSSRILVDNFTSRPLISRPSSSSAARSISSLLSKQTTPRFLPISP